jgi:hypothetical protein
MTTNILPASNVIDVTITNTPSGLTEKNINALALFTQDAPINNEQYGIYLSASQVAANYGSSSKTAQMANNVFSQTPNILTGGGYLTIIPMLAAVSATHGNATTSNISANLAAIIAVTNGSLGVVVDGVAQQLSNLNFTGLTTWAQIAAYLNGFIYDAKVFVNAGNNGLQFGSNKVGTSSTMALAAGTTGINLDGAGYFNGAAATDTVGVNSSGETVLACVARTAQLVGYVPVMTTLDLEDTAIETVASGIQALDNMFIHHCASSQDIAGIVTTVSSAGQTRTRLVTYTQGSTLANLYKAAFAGRAFSVDFTGSKTSQTMNLKQLVNVVPDVGISQTLYNAAEIAGTDVYVSYDGVPSVVSTGGNDFFDNPYSDLALKFALTVAGFDYLRQTNTKVPQTEPGMIGLKDAYRQVMNQFVTNACLAPGQWTSSETFGNQTTFLANITNYGFYIYSQPVAQQASSQREQRIAPLVQIGAKRAGAIHSGDVIVNINA